MMCGLLFGKLDDIELLKTLSLIENKEYKETSDYMKIVQIVNQYQSKYNKDLQSIGKRQVTLQQLREVLNQQILFLHTVISGRVGSEVKEEVIVLDYLITLRQLLLILEENDLQSFHTKAKMEQIVEGTPAQNITADHILAITHKLRSLKML